MPVETSLLWKSILGEIELNVNPSIYATWFKKTHLLRHDASQLVIGVPNAFTQKQLETQFKPLIKQALEKNNLAHKDLFYKISSSSQAVASPPGLLATLTESKVAAPNQWSPTSRLGLNEKYTFDNFIPGSGNELAYAACQAVVNSLGNKYNPLFIYGGVGIGKTHLIQACGNALKRRDPTLKVVYVTIEQFVQEFTDAIRYKRKGDFTRLYRSTDVLIIDDIQFIANKEKTQEEFFHTFNALHEAGRQIIISSDKPPQAIPTLQERLQSRFQMGMAIDMQIPDFETRCAILKSKSEKMNLKLEPECVDFLATNISTNIRVLEGALNQLNVFCETHQVNLATRQLAEKILNQQFLKKTKTQKLTGKQIVEAVASYHQLNSKTLMSSRRDKDIVRPRQIAMYLMRQYLHLSFPKIAKNLNKKDHTTALYAFEKISKELLYDEDLKQTVAEIKVLLKI